jgi:antitoxin component of RelBE/YafQ-DinJ toxin-antitoxin module
MALLVKFIPFVYTIGMNKYSVINLKTDPELKKAAVIVAEELGISISAILNNELKRLTVEKRVVFGLPETPNKKTAQSMKQSLKQIEQGDYHKFDNNEAALEFLENELS